MQAAVSGHPALELMGRPTFCFSFTSDEFNIYHVNDFMRTRGWRFNGQQNPDAIHMCVTGPQTQAGVVEAFVKDLADAVAYAKNPDAIHMCVTGPQTRAGVAEAFAKDLADAVAYAKNPAQPEPQSGGVYGGAGGELDMTDPDVARMVFTFALDAFTDCPF